MVEINKEYDEEFCARIEQVISRAGGIPQLADKTGLSHTVIHKYKNGLSDPSRARLIQLANAAGVSVEWLATGGTVQGIENKQLSVTSDDLIKLPVMNVTASAGGGAAVMSEGAVGFVGFDGAYLRSLNLTVSDLFTMPTIGESMEPTVKAGEFLLCSRSEHHVKPGDGIYVIRLEGDVLVKRLQRLPGEKLLISSDNASYRAYEIQMRDGVDFAILGKVVFVHGLRRV